MALEGSLRDFGLADILQLIYFQKKTGVLSLSGKDRVQLMVYEGNIVAAESRKRIEESRLGKILLKKGLIKEEDLKSCLEEQRSTGVRIGDIFLKRGLVEKADVEETLLSQMTETVVQLFSWKEGTYEFQVQPVSPSKDMPTTLDTQHILMDGLRMVDEWSVMEGKVTLDTVFRKTEKAGSGLNDEEESILKFVDGENDVSIIIDLSGIEDFKASRTLASLMDRDIIAPVQVSSQVSEAAGTTIEWKSPVTGFLPTTAFVVVLVVSLAAATLQSVGSQWGLAALWSGDSADRTRAIKDIEGLRFKSELYKYKTGSYPANLAQVSNIKDPWGRPYLYSVENDSVSILSAGPDGKQGTPDDVY